MTYREFTAMQREYTESYENNLDKQFSQKANSVSANRFNNSETPSAAESDFNTAGESNSIDKSLLPFFMTT